MNTGQTSSLSENVQIYTMDVLNKLARGRANSFEQSRKIFALKDFPRDVYGAQVHKAIITTFPSLASGYQHLRNSEPTNLK